jgi:dipeptidyl aminopeptidase/acylaminoacyl peptidase
MPAAKNGPVASPFDTPSSYIALPRLSFLAASREGDRVVAGIAQLDEDGGKFVTSLYGLDPAGEKPAVRLTRSKEGEAAAGFLGDGRLVFLSRRPATEGESGQEGACLWLSPGDGDPLLVARRPGGMSGLATARDSNTVVVLAEVAPRAKSDEEDKKWWEERRKKKVSAALFSGLPVRHWDSYLGPSETHLFCCSLEEGQDGEVVLRDLTPDAGHALLEAAPVLSPDGSTAVVTWHVGLEAGRRRTDLVAIDTASGARRTILSYEAGEYSLDAPAFSPDGRYVVSTRASRATLEEPEVLDLVLIDLEKNTTRVVDVGDEAYVHGAVFSVDGSSLIVSTDLGGRAPLLRFELQNSQVSRLTAEGAFSAPVPTAAGIFAIAAAPDRAPRPVRLGEEEGDEIVFLPAPGELDSLPGRLEEVSTTVADGTTVRAWLVLPDGASAESPAPLALFVHGGPVSSWNNWQWRWNPWLFAARGYAVLLPDPALSTGYGQKMIKRGWGQWGGAPFDDLMAITDAALARPDLDASRTAALGGSYGGYMANWIAGHTDRFKGIVSHASLWSLEQFQATTDWPAFWADEWGYPDTNPELYSDWSPDRSVDAITTPMLVIHGEKDYRCPVGESLRMWAELVRRAVEARFLWFSDEGHWIMQPGDIVVWYETVLSFLDERVLDKDFEPPAMV